MNYGLTFCHEAINLGSEGKSPVELFSEINRVKFTSDFLNSSKCFDFWELHVCVTHIILAPGVCGRGGPSCG